MPYLKGTLQWSDKNSDIVNLDPIIALMWLKFLSQPNNNHNPNNKTTITVVGLRQSNRWEPPPTTTNSKLHDRTEIE